jgi:tripartite-type tricarboxylate transporter receptor subunit TctC
MLRSLVAALLAAACAAPALAAWPEKPVRLIVPFPAGGAADWMGRSFVQKLSERLGQPVTVDNRAGGGGGIGTEAAAAAAPDGYTLLFGTMGTLTINPALYKSLRYDPVKGFDPISLTHNAVNVLVVHPDIKATSVAELVALARKSPGQLTFASSGNGTTSHLSGELFKSITGVDMVHVPYKGSAPALTDFLGGRISMMFDTSSNFVEHIKAGRVRALGVTSRNRLSAMPGVPSISETPGLSEFEMSLWLGVLAPAGTPKDVINRLNTDIVAVMSTPEMAKAMTQAGLEARVSTPAEFAALIRSDMAKWAVLVRRSGSQLD